MRKLPTIASIYSKGNISGASVYDLSNSKYGENKCEYFCKIVEVNNNDSEIVIIMEITA